MLISDNFYLTSFKLEARSKSSNWTFRLSNAVPVKMTKVRFWIICHNPAFPVKPIRPLRCVLCHRISQAASLRASVRWNPLHSTVLDNIAFEETRFMNYICLNTLELQEQNSLCFCLHKEGNICPELPECLTIHHAQDKYQ